MKVKIPASEATACDLCHRLTQSFVLTKCVVCGNEYCHACEAIMCGCIHQPKVCKECGRTEIVENIVQKFAQPILNVLDSRTKALIRARRKVASARAQNMRKEKP